MGEIAAVLICGMLFPGLVFYALIPLLVTAWRTGVLPGRVVDYPRAERPGMFWFGIGLCIFIILLSLFAAYAVFWHFITTRQPA